MIAHVGDDAASEQSPERDPDTVEVIRIVRAVPLGTLVTGHDAAANHFSGMMASVSPVMAERLRHNLKLKGH